MKTFLRVLSVLSIGAPIYALYLGVWMHHVLPQYMEAATVGGTIMSVILGIIYTAYRLVSTPISKTLRMLIDDTGFGQ